MLEGIHLLEESDERGHAELEALVNDCIVELDTLLVDGIITTSRGDDSGPSQRETVGVGTVRLHHWTISS